jgi:hypothetical protein
VLRLSGDLLGELQPHSSEQITGPHRENGPISPIIPVHAPTRLLFEAPVNPQAHKLAPDRDYGLGGGRQFALKDLAYAYPPRGMTGWRLLFPVRIPSPPVFLAARPAASD